MTNTILALYGITVPAGQAIEAIAYGEHGDGVPLAYIYTRRPLNDDLRDEDVWTALADFVVELPFDYSVELLQHGMADCWPDALVLYFPCTCCCGGDLIELNACSYCRRLKGHHDACPANLPAGKSWVTWTTDARRQWLEGFELARSGQPMGELPPSGQLGYDAYCGNLP